MTKLLVDRPRAPIQTIKEGKGKGRRVIGSYSWGEPSDPLPVMVRVFIDRDDADHFIEEFNGPFTSLDEIDQQALAVATDWCERGNS